MRQKGRPCSHQLVKALPGYGQGVIGLTLRIITTSKEEGVDRVDLRLARHGEVEQKMRKNKLKVKASLTKT